MIKLLIKIKQMGLTNLTARALDQHSYGWAPKKNYERVSFWG